MKKIAHCLLVMCAAVIGGCGSPDTAAVDDYIRRLAAAQCQWEFRCCTDAQIEQREMGKFKDQATCEEFRQLALEYTTSDERLAVRQGRLSVDRAQADACLAQRTALSCDPAPGSPPPPPSPGMMNPCLLVFKGAAGAGDECRSISECAKGASCVFSGGPTGVCVPHQQENEICNSSNDCDPSVANLYCAKQDFRCHRRSPAGGPCAYTIDMVTAMPKAPLLLECDDSTGSLFCDPGAMTCRAMPTTGEPCLRAPLPPDVFASCAAGLTCDPSGGPPGICRGPGAVGEDCSFIFCESTLYCDRAVTPNVCKQPAGLGAPCSFALPCEPSLYCDTAAAMPTCLQKLADGATCTQSQLCVSGQCFGGICIASPFGAQCIGRNP